MSPVRRRHRHHALARLAEAEHPVTMRDPALLCPDQPERPTRYPWTKRMDGPWARPPTSEAWNRPPTSDTVSPAAATSASRIGRGRSNRRRINRCSGARRQANGACAVASVAIMPIIRSPPVQPPVARGYSSRGPVQSRLCMAPDPTIEES